MLKEGRVPVQSTEGGGLGTTIDAKAQLMNMIPRSRKKRKGDPAVDAKKPRLMTASAFSGEGGIRTREPLWEVTRFPDAPLQPLEHLSFAVCGCKYKQKYVNFVILSGKLMSICRK